jgi:hypothetical protein
MQTHFRFMVAVAVAVTSTAAVAQPTLLDQLLGRVLNGGKAADSSSSTPPLGTPNASKAAMSEAQASAIDTLVLQKTQDEMIAREKNEAQILIKDMLEVASCGTANSAWMSMNRRHMKPSNHSRTRASYVAAGQGEYHDNRYCYDVVEVGSFKKPASNALAFSAKFISPISQEAFSQSYIIQKSPEGSWMIRNIELMY